MRILISRTDRIGDVVLTLPLIGVIKEFHPDAEISFLASNYTLPLFEHINFLQKIYPWETIAHEALTTPWDYFIHAYPRREIAKFALRSQSKIRIGTSHRIYHWIYCNKLVPLGRRHSSLHEAQLNVKLLEGMQIKARYIPLTEMYRYIPWKTAASQKKLTEDRFHLILHLKSGGSAPEWPAENFLSLAQALDKEQITIHLTGSESEGLQIKKEIPEILNLPHVVDQTGQFDLHGLITFMEQCDGFISASTGPLHLAAVSGLRTLGLFSDKAPVHAGRWGPIGPYAQTISGEACRNLLNIETDAIHKIINQWIR